MYLLTRDRQVRSQLSLLLRELGQKPEFYENANDLLEVLSVSESPSTCLIDIDVNLDPDMVERFKLVRAYSKLIGFVRYQAEAETRISEVSEIFELTIILPSHAERAKARLKAALRQTGLAAAGKRMNLNARANFPLKR
jgi:DNA-binding NtrC family response regulator